jgi:hypothetical protein
MPIRRPKLPPELATWVTTPGGALFCGALRRRIENGGKLDRVLALDMTARQRSDLIALFGQHPVGPGRIHLGAADKAIRASRFSISLRGLLIAESGPLITRRGRARYERLVKAAAVQSEHHDLLTFIHGVDELADEHALLAAVVDTGTWRVPDGTRTGTSSWPTYRAALRAAAEWYRGRKRHWKFGERELAALVLGGSKRWTDPARTSFCLLIGKPFTEAVYTTDTAVTLIGPLRWFRENLVADAGEAAPFLGLPGRAAASERLEVPAAGILLIENKETFEAVGRTGISKTWLCVWMSGFGSDALVDLLCVLPPVPVAAWGDLDPPGIEIIQNLSERSGRRILPVGMDASDYAKGPYLDEPAEDRLKWKTNAEELTATSLPSLVPLAEAIAANAGRRCEQEGLHEHIIPVLETRLRLLTERVLSPANRQCSLEGTDQSGHHRPRLLSRDRQAALRHSPIGRPRGPTSTSFRAHARSTTTSLTESAPTVDLIALLVGRHAALPIWEDPARIR